jgi:hypothetical protein
VVIQQSAPSWFDTVAPSRVEHDGIRRVVRSVRRDGPRVGVVVAYHAGDWMWTHAWDSYRISQKQLTADLASAGLRFGRWLTDDHAWFAAGPIAAGLRDAGCWRPANIPRVRSDMTASCAPHPRPDAQRVMTAGRPVTCPGIRMFAALPASHLQPSRHVGGLALPVIDHSATE